MAGSTHSIPSVKRDRDALKKPATAPYGLHVIESCIGCPLIADKIFCDLSKIALVGLDDISSQASYPKGATLFVEGQEPRGVFVVCSGRVKLSAGSAGGKTLILRIAESGEVVGLPSTISGKPYEVTAEALEPIQANFIRREPFLKFLREHGEARYLALSGSAAGKLARYLLDFAQAHGKPVGGKVRATMILTQEEIAEMIGASRETVTRLLATFKRRGLIEVHGSSLVIKDIAGLEKVV
jgi:CRP/FNR family cyclic AMP-dependent transcriptional regulator